ncbi:MAG: hypothetical protein J6X19_06680 [Clostridia bacterium]|nr:hypothetical protein [Clostridia bacterium]
MLEIREVKTRREQREFVKLPLKLYKGDPYYVPMLYSGEFAIFKPDNPFNKVCDTVCYTAYKDGEAVGRIQGIIQREANRKWDQKRVRFTRFDCVDDEEVAAALFAKVESWAKAKGMEEFVGPRGYSDLEREGLLIEGFDQPQTFEEQNNYTYYQRLIEAYGFEKDVDWLESRLYEPADDSEQLIELGQKMLRRYGLRVYQAKTLNELLTQHVGKIFELIDKTYSRLYGTMPLSDEIVANYVKDFKMIVRAQDVMMLYDSADNLVGFALMFPSIAEAVRKSRGYVTPAFLARFLKAKKHPEIIDLALIGILPEWEAKGVAAIMIALLMKMLKESDLDHLETNLILEDNYHMQNLLKRFNHEQNKRRRCFKKQIG